MPKPSLPVEIARALLPLLEADRRLGVAAWPIPVTPSTARVRGSAPPSRGAAPVEIEGDGVERLRVLSEDVAGCTKCGLSATRTRTVFGQGNPRARLVFVGEAPGFDEDRQGLAFVGKAGQLLTKMIEAMGTTREDVFICNVLKCRPPNNRTPAPDEIASCSPYLRQQLAWIHPEVIVALGAPASQTLLSTVESIGRLRGRFHEYYLSGVRGEGASVALMPTYHPAYLLRNPADKIKAWEDLKQVMSRLGLQRPGAS